MSKPDPSITANLLKSVLAKPEVHHAGTPAHPDKHNHAELHGEGPAPKSNKPSTAKHSAAGAGRMRSSNRGK